MSDLKSLTINSGQIQQIGDSDNLFVGSGLKTTGSTLTISAVSGGAGTMTWSNALTSVTLSQNQASSGAGVAWTIRGQQGASGQVGGTLTIGGGDNGTPGSGLAGGVDIQLGAAVAGLSAKMRFMSGATEVGSIQKYGGGDGITILSATSIIAMQAATSFSLEATNGIAVINATSDVYLSGTSHIFRTAAQQTAFTLVTSASGTNSWTYVSGIGAVRHAIADTSTNSATGASHILRAQNATGTTTTGGSISLQSGSGTSTDGYMEVIIDDTRRFQVDGAGKVHIGAASDITTAHRINGATQTTVGASGGASALPANPRGYILLDIGGTSAVIPFYNPS